MDWLKLSHLGLLCIILSSCVSHLQPSSRTHVILDGGPANDVDVTHIVDAIPKPEKVTIAGNKSPYTVLGKTYYVNFDTQGFTETGLASWYGKKFHGNKTSNGEVYDMFAMTAAHKTIAIPSYVRVTNLENQRVVVVRVNDRGPFHDGRIIDLSYTAAKKLGYQENGTAKVQIEVLPYGDNANIADVVKAAPVSQSKPLLVEEQTHLSINTKTQTFLQAGAFTQEQSAVDLQRRLIHLTGHAVEIRIEPQRNLYKVLIGPILDNFALLNLRQKLFDANMPDTHVVEL